MILLNIEGGCIANFKDALWKYKGRRITKNMRNGMVRTALYIYVPFFLLSMGIIFIPHILNFEEWLSFERLIYIQDWNWSLIVKGILVSALVGVIPVVVGYFLFYGTYKKIWHRQKIARMFISNKYAESVPITRESQFGDKKLKKEKLNYFPKAYYRSKGGYIYLKIALDMTRHQKRYLELDEELEKGLFAELVDKTIEENYVKYKLLYDIEKNRISIHDVEASDGKIKLMKHITWDYEKLPHMLIAGGTGGGKSYFMLTMIKSFLDTGAELKILDPKNSDLADLENVLPKGSVYSKSTGIMMTLRKSVEGMLERSEEIKKMPNYKTGSNYSDVGLKPVFIVFDEYVAFLELVSREDRAKALEYIKQIVMLGRQMGYFLVLGQQRPDAKYLADGIRDQFHFRVALGKMSETGYGMMFGDTDKLFTFKDVKGRGYADVGSSVITEFYTPLVPKDYDFMTQIGHAVQGQESGATAVANGSD